MCITRVHVCAARFRKVHSCTILTLDIRPKAGPPKRITYDNTVDVRPKAGPPSIGTVYHYENDTYQSRSLAVPSEDPVSTELPSDEKEASDYIYVIV